MARLCAMLMMISFSGVVLCHKSIGEPSAKIHEVTLKPLSTPTAAVTNTTDLPFVTFSPSKPEQYVMVLSHTGPAVLGSTVVFTVELIPESNSTQGPLRFIYQWMNMANMHMNKTTDGLVSKLSITFGAMQSASGDHTMTVAAFLENDPSKIVAFETKKFVLTETLNGALLMHQALEYQRFPTTFSTVAPVEVFAHVRDHFRKEQIPMYEFYWFQGEKFLYDTKNPNMTTTVGVPSNFTFKSVIIVSFVINDSISAQDGSDDSSWNGQGRIDSSQKGNSSYLSHSRHSLLRRSADSLSRPWSKRLGDLMDGEPCYGNFEQFVSFKDPLKFCNVVRADSTPHDRGVKIGVPALVNVTCSGSAPSSVCVNISSVNGSIPVNETCTPVDFVDTVQHQVQFVLNTTGWSEVHLYIYNDVSRTHIVQSYYGYNPGSLKVPALIIPIVFVVFGIIIVLAGGTYVMRLRKKPLVEVADFDFHPTLTTTMQSEFGVRISRVVNTIKFAFSRNRNHSRHAEARTSKSSSSMRDEEETPPKHFYDSL